MPKADYDFCGWATKNDLKCSDGRIIRHNAFKVNDGQQVPLVFNHSHGDPSKILGHAILENRDEGVYAYGYFNNTRAGQDAKEAVKHGDVNALSIWANNLQQAGSEVLHGVIREVSLVLAGANPGAFIESVVAHSLPMEDGDDEGIFYTNEFIISHADSDIKAGDDKKDEKKEEPDVPDTKDAKKTGSDEPTVGEVYETLNDNQKIMVDILIDEAVKQALGNNKETKEDKGDDDVKHNIFNSYEEGEYDGNVLSHADMDNILSAAKRGNSLRDTFNEYCAVNDIQHDDGIEYHTGTSTYGINDMDMLFPDLKNVTNTPTWISRRMEWVDVILKGVHRTPFSRIKSLFADITQDEARAKGYIKGHQKVTEVFSTLKRTTTPTTIYKLQKVDRDDVIDITDFDVIAWIKSEMRVMLDEEIARAILVGDGRQSTDPDYINRDNIRPIVSDADLFNVKVGINATIPTDVSNQTAIDAFAKSFVNSVIFNYRKYKGSGNPTAFMQESVLSCLLLAEDGMGRKLYPTMETLKTALRVKDIVTVEVMEGVNITYKVNTEDVTGEVMCILVNLNDYNVGADKGGAISMFDDFDINFNKNEYLIETRISGALTRPYSAMTIVAVSE